MVPKASFQSPVDEKKVLLHVRQIVERTKSLLIERPDIGQSDQREVEEVDQES